MAQYVSSAYLAREENGEILTDLMKTLPAMMTSEDAMRAGREWALENLPSIHRFAPEDLEIRLTAAARGVISTRDSPFEAGSSTERPASGPEFLSSCHDSVGD